MNIRKATIDDINELARLNSEVQSLHVDIEPDVFCDVGEADLREFFQNRLAQADFRTFIAEDEGYPVGYMSVRVARRPGHLFVKKREAVTIDQICATKHCRQKGVGKALVQVAHDLAAQEGIERVELDVWCANDGAVAAFKAMGFEAYNLKMRMPTNPAAGEK